MSEILSFSYGWNLHRKEGYTRVTINDKENSQIVFPFKDINEFNLVLEMLKSSDTIYITKNNRNETVFVTEYEDVEKF